MAGLSDAAESRRRAIKSFDLASPMSTGSVGN
jgi:hypothetical protein